MYIIQRILESIAVKQMIISNSTLLSNIEKSEEATVQAFKGGNRVFFCGNYGSAADAQQLAAELSARFCFDRPPLPAEDCNVNSSFITTVADDYSFNRFHSRHFESLAWAGEILFAISTSGKSQNILEAIYTAKQKK